MNINEIGDRFGLWQSITGTAAGEYDATGVFDYRCIKDGECHGLRKLPADIKFVDPEDTTYGDYAQTPWGYGPESLTYLTYDDAASVEHKAKFVKLNGLGGMMCWDLSGDLAVTHQDSLIAAVHHIFSIQQNTHANTNLAARQITASITDSDNAVFSEMQTSDATQLEPKLTMLIAILNSNTKEMSSLLGYCILMKDALLNSKIWIKQQLSAYLAQKPQPKMPWLDRGAETNTAEPPCHYPDGSTNVIADYGIDSEGIKHHLIPGDEESAATPTALLPQCQQAQPWITSDSINKLGKIFHSSLFALFFGALNKSLERAAVSLGTTPKKAKHITLGINLATMTYGISQGANVFAVLMPLAINNSVRWGVSRLGASPYLSMGLGLLASVGVSYWQSDDELFLLSWGLGQLCYFIGEQLVSWTVTSSKQGLFAQRARRSNASEFDSSQVSFTME